MERQSQGVKYKLNTIMENGNTNTASRAMEEAVSEIRKLWEEGEVRITSQEVDRKRSSVKKVVEFSIEYLSILGKFDAISNSRSSDI